jgi:glycosyltransferase involved in cell wall biosynthesis
MSICIKSVLKILLISTHWPSNQRSGVSLAAIQHAQILIDEGYALSIVGSHPAVLSESIGAKKKYYVDSCGSAALYSNARVDSIALEATINNADPDLILIESWQTALSDAAIKIGSTMGRRVMMISHGVSVHPLSWLPRDIGRSIAWLHYLFLLLPRLISKLCVLTTLSLSSQSKRFYDRDLAFKHGIPVLPLFNKAVHIQSRYIQRKDRKQQVLVVGYFSYIKNQLTALRLAKELAPQIQFKFVGEKSGKYYEHCINFVRSSGIESHTTFENDKECNLSEEIAQSSLVLSTSLTEALPITLLESMAAGTPFIASNVGAVSDLQGGVTISGDLQEYKSAILKLLSDQQLWQSYSDSGRVYYSQHYESSQVRQQLLSAVQLATSRSMTLEVK